MNLWWGESTAGAGRKGGTSFYPPSRGNPVYWIYFENYFASGSGVQMYSLIVWGFTSYKFFIASKEFHTYRDEVFDT